MNFREHTQLSGDQVDDTPFGGGAGMVLRVDVLDGALRTHYGVDPVLLREQRRVIALDAGGRTLDDSLVDELAAEPALTLLCGRYEGFDERIVEHFSSDVVSVGRYVLSGGELAAMVLCDAVLRKRPGALGHERSALEESFSVALDGHPEYPHYTRPAEYRGACEVLLSGHHERIEQWRRERSPRARRTRRGTRAREAEATPGEACRADGSLPLLLALAEDSSRVLPGSIKARPLSLMSSVIATIERAQLRRVPNFSPGDRVKVHFQVTEGARNRVQVFEGVVIKPPGTARAGHAVRKQSFGVGVERFFRVHSPNI